MKNEWQSLPLGSNGQVVAQGKLADGKIEKGRLAGDAATTPLDLRLLVRLPSGGKLPRRWELEFMLPVAVPQP